VDLEQSKAEWTEKQQRFEASMNPMSFSDSLPTKLPEVLKLLAQKEEERERTAEKVNSMGLCSLPA
jgi:hypothetical protein